MIMSNLELAQATVEIFAGFVCIMSIVIMSINGNRSAGLTWIKRIFGLVACIFFFEAAAYTFRGNVDTLSIAMTRISNFVVFILNLGLGIFFIRYIYTLIGEGGVSAKRLYVHIADGLFFAGVLVVVISLFNNWMYYFDDHNYYHRNYMWYVYTAISMMIVLAGCYAAVEYRKVLTRATLTIILIYAVIPVLAILIQSWFYGISITILGIACGVVSMLFVYLRDWSAGNIDDEEIEGKKHNFDVIILFLIMVISMSASIVSCILSIGRISGEKSLNDSQLVANMVADTIETELIKPITVSRTLSNDYTLRQYLESDRSAEDLKEDMQKYLISLRDAFNYQMVYVVSSKTNAYYTYDGIAKFIDIENDPHDVWYRDFVASGKDYELNVDTDEANNWALSVFVNTRIEDKAGELIGAGGVGVPMNHLEQMLAEFEDKYKITVYLTNKDGLTQIAADGAKIENYEIDNEFFKNLNADDFYVELLEDCNRFSKYMEDLGWYLIIEDRHSEKLGILAIIAPSIIVFMIGIIMMAVVFTVVTIKERRAIEELKNKRIIALTDELTQCYNRRAYEEDCAIIKEKHDVAKTAFVMMDINGLKAVNDNIGHAAGDELIKGAATCMKKCFGHFGRVYRTGGDEFVAVLKVNKDQLNRLLADFDYLVNNWSGELVKELSISRGVVVCADYPELHVYEMQELADKLMYEDKAEYYRRTGKDRRVN